LVGTVLNLELLFQLTHGLPFHIGLFLFGINSERIEMALESPFVLDHEVLFLFFSAQNKWLIRKCLVVLLTFGTLLFFKV